MLIRRYWKWLALALTLIALLACSYFFIKRDLNTCMGVEMKSEEEITSLYEKINYDYSGELLFNNEPCAIEIRKQTIYISQNIDEYTTPCDLLGKLSVSLPGYSLFFIRDAAFDDLWTTVRSGASVRLAVVNTDNKYVEYNVLFTTLPLLRLDGEFSHLDEDDREINSGSICLWNPNDPTSESYSVSTSLLEWRVRGNTSALLPKKPYKLSLKDKKGENRNYEFFDLGADDDWILNPLNTDDIFLREKLAMDLWNDSFAGESYNTVMSEGEYVEIIVNGSYGGIYLLQRRVDAKLLGLDTDDILLKGTYATVADDPLVAYEITSSPLESEETFKLLESLGLPTGADIMNIDNFIDVSLMIQLGSMADNKGYKNTFYVIERDGDSYSLKLAMWDTDLSFASNYTNWFNFDYDGKLAGTFNRCEYADMLEKHPQLNRLMAERWFELRESILTTENMFRYLDSDYAVLEPSGALQRDLKVWGIRHGGLDTVEVLKKFITERLTVLDAYYSEYLK